MLPRIKVTLITYSTCFLATVVLSIGAWNSYTNESIPTEEEPAPSAKTAKPATTKTILLWSDLYKSRDWAFGFGEMPFRQQCPGSGKCRTTADRAELANADAVVFHIAHMQATLGQSQTLGDLLPARGKPGQVYVFWNHEPPLEGRRSSLTGLRGVFNVTITYRPDSTIYLPLHKIERLSTPTAAPNASYIMAKKTDLACWVVSACQKSHSHRNEYAEELSASMDFDVYGKCGNLTCPSDGMGCFEELSVRYKFYFAFENSYCRDYITEKPFRTLKNNWVPIVLGASNYSAHLPPKSFIDVRDFYSPKSLAQYLRYLDQNDDKYMEYLQSKRFFFL
ncbi:hypothetical protein LSH36_1057g00090 [Paralvinella palmiformis]|uniref:Fucosyltransferase n=1 Tax=Paralvinella palmiformis TaxID=53620 RepID=A0AAD9IVE4_9ANNE|nr:hypothetical protein LSH36_1057g00090 [Paralvinella palmiformis]